MTLNPLLREWLVLDEAVEHFSSLMEEPVTEADVLGWALDGHLNLSVYLPEGTPADSWELSEDWDRPDNTAKNYWEDIERPEITKPVRIDGVWDLVLVPPTSQLIERRHNELRGLPPISVNTTVGALVDRAGRENTEATLRCRLRIEGAMPSSAPAPVLPSGSRFVVRTTAIAAFVSAVSKLVVPSPTDSLDKPLGTRERTSLLIVIAALANHDKKIPLTSPSKAAEAIEALTEAMGARISARRIEDYLNLIPDALERRGKIS